MSGVTPTTFSLTDLKEKRDLLDLFGKYDLEHNETMEGNFVDDVDLIEEKMKQFEVSKNDLETTGKHNKKSDDNDSLLVDVPEKVTESGSHTEDPVGETAEIVEPIMGSSADDKPSETINFMTIQPYIIPDDSSPVADVTGAADEEANDDDEPFDQDGDILTIETIGPSEELQELESATPQPTSVPPVRPSLHRKDSIVRASETANPNERYQQSHKPFDFLIFLNHLKKKSADPIVRYTRSFLLSFTKHAKAMTSEQMALAIRQFRDFINEKFHAYEPFASMDAVDLENSVEGVEKLIMNRLYEYCFSPEAIKKLGPSASDSVFDDVKEDQDLLLSLEKFSWVLGVHLDVNLDEIAQRKNETSKESLISLDSATNQLNKINNYRAPRDKIICILNSCKILFNMLKVSNQETNADAFMPLLILTIIRAKTPDLISNLRYIERYRGEDWLNHGETSYYLSSVQGAISFIRNIKKEDLSISDEVYDANMEAWEAELRQRPQVVNPISVRGTARQQDATRPMTSSEVLFASAEMFTKSISNFISPSPQERSPPPPPPANVSTEETSPSAEEIDLVFGQLTEVFPSLDKSILRDIIIMNNANIEKSLDICLTLVNEN